MNRLTQLFAGSLLLFIGQSAAETIALQNAKILTAASPAALEQGTILIKDGRITAVGQNISLPAGVTLIDLSGKTVTPGLVAADTLLGMVEISGGANAAETGSKIAAISAGYDVQYAINPHSSAIAVARQGGVTTAIVMPNPGAGNANYAGQAAFLKLAASPTTEAKVGVVWEMRANAVGRGTVFVQLQAELADVRRYAKNKNALNKGELTAKDWSVADLEALVAVVQAKRPLIVRVDKAADIATLLHLAKAEKIKLVLVGAAEGWKVATQIAEAEVPVLLDPTNNLPSSFDEIGASADNAAALVAAGVTVVLRGGASAHDAGKVRYFAGMAVARGVPYNIALQAITVTPARVFSEQRVGSIAPGQQADLAVWSGDPFEPLTELNSLYINGKLQPLTSRQNQLETKYIKTLPPAAALTDNR